MHDVPHLLIDLAIALGTAAVTTLISRKLKLPVIFGYLLAGLLVGSNVPIPLAASAENLHVMAELGIVLIMFGIGMEFSVKKVLRAGPKAALMATFQTALVMVSGILVGKMLGWGPLEGVFIGAGMIATSTVVIVKLFEDTSPSKTLRETVFSVTIMHDLFAIVLMTVLIALTKVGAKGLNAADIVWIMAKFVLFLAGVIAAGRLFVPQFLRKLADSEKPENLVIASIGFCFCLALLAAASGFSLAIGAFAAGMLAAESGREKLIEKLIKPTQDIFTALFFVSVGMMIVPKDVLAYLHIILLFVALVILANAIALTAGGLLAGHTFRNSFQSSIALGQFGEFAFVMMNIGIFAGVVRPELFSVTVSVAVITALTSMYLFKASGRMSDAIEQRLPPGFKAALERYQAWAASLLDRKRIKTGGSALKKPIAFILLDFSTIVALTVGYGYILEKIPMWTRGLHVWDYKIAPAVLAVLLWLTIAYFVLSLNRRSHFLSLQFATMSLDPEVEGDGLKGWPILIGGLRTAMIIGMGLPLFAILQAFVPTALLVVVALGLFAYIVFIHIYYARKLGKDDPTGMKGLLDRFLVRHDHDKGRAAPGRGRIGPFCFLPVDEKCPWLGEPLSALNLAERAKVGIVALLRDGRNIVPLRPSPALQPNDRIVLIGSKKALSAAEAVLYQSP